jgi:hypothetical protein
MTPDGQFTAATGGKHTATIVTAKVGALSGTARVRTIPPLPWNFDFEDIALAVDSKTGRTEAEPPTTWIGARYRHKVREVDGEKVMVKVTYIPKGTRSQMWMGNSDLSDYTIQADLKGAIEGNQMPDMGVIAQRYTLDMLGADQKLQVRMWPPQVRTHFSKTVPFAWKPNVWYTLKLQAATLSSDGKAPRVAVRGKVWPRDSKEPTEWTVEAVDETPNLVGSPGLYGDSTNAEIYIDNIRVTRNGTAQTAAAKSQGAPAANRVQSARK